MTTRWTFRNKVNLLKLFDYLDAEKPVGYKESIRKVMDRNCLSDMEIEEWRNTLLEYGIMGLRTTHRRRKAGVNK